MPVEVFLDEHATVVQPELFRVCPLGLQFYASRPVPEFTTLSFNMKIGTADGAAEEVSCSGVVVHCRHEKETGFYRVWVKFLDLPDAKNARIKCIARDAKLSCPHCENS